MLVQQDLDPSILILCSDCQDRRCTTGKQLLIGHWLYIPNIFHFILWLLKRAHFSIPGQTKGVLFQETKIYAQICMNMPTNVCKQRVMKTTKSRTGHCQGTRAVIT